MFQINYIIKINSIELIIMLIHKVESFMFKYDAILLMPLIFIR